MNDQTYDPPKRVKKHLVHAVAECTECDWKTDDYLTAQDKARGHSHTTGHLVILDLGYICEYHYEKDDDD